MRALRALVEFVVLFVGLLLYIVIGVPRALWQDWRRR